MKGTVCLVITTLVHILFVHTADTFKGIKMCQRDCEQTKGCTETQYDFVQLECRLLFNVKNHDDARPSAVTKRIVKNSAMKNLVDKCSANDRVIINKQGRGVCVEMEADNAGMEYSWLLLVGFKLHKVHLKTHAVQEVHFPLKNIFRVAYMKTANRFIIAHSKELSSISATNMKTTSLRRGIDVDDIGVDEAQDIIFLKILTKSYKFQICTMSRKGLHLKCFEQDIRPIDVFAVNTNDQLVYINRNMRLDSYTYKGTQTEVLVQNIGYVNRMVYDPAQDVLYCQLSNRLVRVTKTGKIKEIIFTKFLKMMTIQGNNLYLRKTRIYNRIFVMDVRNPLKLKGIIVPEDNSGYSCCLF